MNTNQTSEDREFSLSLAAGDSFTYTGYQFLRVQSITNIDKVHIKTDRGDDFHLGLSQMHRFAGKKPNYITIENDGGSATVVELLMGDGLFSDPELSGTVSIDDSDSVNVEFVTAQSIIDDTLRSRSAAGSEFRASGFIGALAANYSKLQLLNPTGSGVTLEVNKLNFKSNATGYEVALYSYAPGLSGAGMFGVNKDVGGTAGKGQIRQAQEGTLASGSLVDEGYFTSANAYEPVDIIKPNDSPIILGAGEGAVLIVKTVQVGLYINAEWSEK